MHAKFVSLALLSLPGWSSFLGQGSPAIGGFVTRAGTTAYEVNGASVVCDPARTRESVATGGGKATVEHGCPARVLGDSVTVYGHKRKQMADIEATQVEVDQPTDLPVSGYALIDKVVMPLTNGSVTLRADGYPLTITSATKVTVQQGSSLTLATVTTNVWVRYVGTLHANGSVTTTSALFSPNAIKPNEDKLRTKTDFDAASITEEDRQSTASRFFLGTKAKKLPASKDEAGQRRLSAIGQRLVPAYQRQLAADDPTRIDFRFQLVHDSRLEDYMTSPSGVIQVSEGVLRDLPDDAQLAAVVAAAIAEVLEKQVLRAAPGNNARSAAGVAGDVAGIFLPGAGLATGLANWKSASVAERHQVEQSARTSLSFLQDAGLDLGAAPVAWWTLAKPAKKTLAETRLPYRTQYLYRLLSTMYRPVAAGHRQTN